MILHGEGRFRLAGKSAGDAAPVKTQVRLLASPHLLYKVGHLDV
jgi:hypothetical protein